MERGDRVTFGRVVAAFVFVLLAAVAVLIFGFGWDLKAVIGWRALVDYIDPGNAPERKDAVQVYAVIVAGAIAAATAVVGFTNLYYTRRNLEQQREIEEKRAEDAAVLEAQRDQGSALQAYYEQLGKLLTEYDLGSTASHKIRLLARAQTLTVLQGLDPPRKSRLLLFLIGSDLVQKNSQEEPPTIDLGGVDLHEADLKGADLKGADLKGADLGGANLSGADLKGAALESANLSGATLTRAKLCESNLSKADLSGATLTRAKLGGSNLYMANMSQAILTRAVLDGANLTRAKVTEEQLGTAWSHEGATIVDLSAPDPD